MKAVVLERYGPPAVVLTLKEVPVPSVGDDEVLVRVRGTAIAGDDWHLMRGEPYVARLGMGLRGPKNRIPGEDVAGLVEACGRGVTDLRSGDEVFGWCTGAFAELACTAAENLAKKPADLTFEEAATVPTSGFTALQALRDEGGIQPGHRVLIIGASGGVGTLAVQLARSFEAEVTAVCSTRNVELVRDLGAHHVVDYTQEHFAARGPTFDIVVRLAGAYTLSECRRALTPRGTLVLVGGAGGRWLGGVASWPRALLTSPFVRQRLRPLVHTKDPDDLETLRQLLDSGRIRPVLGASYPLNDVLGALRHFEEGHARGKVAITVPGGGQP